MALLLFGPGIAVRNCGAKGSSGKKGCSDVVCSRSCAVAILAAGLVVVVIDLMVARRGRERKGEESRRIEDMVEKIFDIDRAEKRVFYFFI